MSTAKNTTLVRRFVEEVVNRGDLARFDEFLAPDFRLSVHGRTVPPGREIYRQLVAGLLAALPDFRYDVEAVIAEGDQVVLRGIESGTHLGVFEGVAPTGKRLSWSSVNIVRVVDGKLVEEWALADRLGRLQQLGATLSLPATTST